MGDAPIFSQASDTWPGLAKLSEECGEVVQVIGKFVQSGATGFYQDGSATADLPAMLSDEMADLYAALDFVYRRCPVDREAISARRTRKLRLFEEWAEEADRG